MAWTIVQFPMDCAKSSNVFVQMMETLQRFIDVAALFQVNRWRFMDSLSLSDIYAYIYFAGFRIVCDLLMFFFLFFFFFRSLLDSVLSPYESKRLKVLKIKQFVELLKARSIFLLL